MTDFDTLRIKVGRRPITVVEIDLDFCQNTYGVSPCTAAVGVTGSQKCFNTFKTCQDQPDYVLGTKTYRFCSNDAFLPVGQTIFPCVTNVDIAPTTLDPKGFSVSASATVTLQDFPYHDREIDPYISERTYQPMGTFFGKLRARNPYLVNRVMRVMTAYVDNDRTIYTQARTYFIDHMEGPDATGQVQIVAKDVLRFADAEKSQAPVQSDGTLSADITATSTSITLSPTGVGAEYASSGIVRLDDELISYTSKSGDTISGLTRGYKGTTADAHSAAVVVQICIRYNDQSIPSIIKDLLVTYAGIDASYIPIDDWEAEALLWLGSLTCPEVILSTPAGVDDLVNEVITSTGCALWWDEEGAQLRFKVIVPFKADNAVPAWNEQQHILQGSVQVEDEEDERISRVVVYFTPTSAIADPDASTMQNVSVSIDEDAEGPNEYGVSLTQEIVSRWIPELIDAQQLGTRLLKRYGETPRQVTLNVDAKDATLKVGDLVDVSTRLILDPTGANLSLRYIVLQKTETVTGTTYQYVLLQVSTTASARVFDWAPEDAPDWTDASDDQKSSLMFWSDEDGLMPDLTPGSTLS